MIVANANANEQLRQMKRRRANIRDRGMGAVSPYLYSAPAGLVTFSTTPFTTTTGPQGSVTSGGNVIYPGGGGGSGSAPPASYVPPTLIGAPGCSSSDPWTASSAECIALLLGNQAHDLGVSAGANYNVFLQNCLNTFPQPTDCYQRTFGLTPAGGFTGGFTGNVPRGVNAEQFITGQAPTIKTPTPSNNQQTQQFKQATQQAQGGGGGIITVGGHDITSIVDSISGDVSVGGFDIPIWALGIAALGVVAVFVGGRG